MGVDAIGVDQEPDPFWSDMLAGGFALVAILGSVIVVVRIALGLLGIV